MTSVSAEAQRQRALLAALLAPQPPEVPVLPGGLREAPERALRGLQAYRANAHASAARALEAAFPTVAMMLGEAAFRSLCTTFWHAHPPQRGDLGEWGEALPAWLGAQPELAEWPYLADCARLDHALHACERAADGELDTASLARLGDTEPSRLRLALAPGCALVESCWPIAAIHEAHRRGGGDADDDAVFAALRSTIEAARESGRGDAVLVARDGWRAACHCVQPHELGWTRQLLAGADLDAALAAADPAFDFAAWLARAVSSRWLAGVVTIEAG